MTDRGDRRQFDRWLRRLRWLLDHVNEERRTVEAKCPGCGALVSMPYFLFNLPALSPHLFNRDMFVCGTCKARDAATAEGAAKASACPRTKGI